MGASRSGRRGFGRKVPSGGGTGADSEDGPACQRLGKGGRSAAGGPRRAARGHAGRGLAKLHGPVGDPLPQRGLAAEGALLLTENLRPRQPPPDPVRGIAGRRVLRLGHGEYALIKANQACQSELQMCRLLQMARSRCCA